MLFCTGWLFTSFLKSAISDFISIFIESMSFLRDCISSAKKCTLLDSLLLSDLVGLFDEVVGFHGPTLVSDASFVDCTGKLRGGRSIL